MWQLWSLPCRLFLLLRFSAEVKINLLGMTDLGKEVAMRMWRFLNIATVCLAGLFWGGCSEDIDEKNSKLLNLVDMSFVRDVKAKHKYRYEVGIGGLTEEERIDVIRECAERHCKELKEILEKYQPEMRIRRGPYGTSRMVFSADQSLLSELKALIGVYESLLLFLREHEDASIENVHKYIMSIRLHKRNFDERARLLRLSGGVL